METINILKRARELIKDRKNWCQFSAIISKGADGSFAYCALGALNRISSASFYEIGVAGNELRKDPEVKGSIAIFNDTHTHAEVLALFDRRIAALGKK